MIYKNSFKITMSNFKLVSRILIFMLVQGLFLFGLSYMFCLPIVRVLSEGGFFVNLQVYSKEFFANLNLPHAMQNVKLLTSSLLNIISQNWAGLFWSLFGLGATLVLFGAYFQNFYGLIVNNSLYQFMSNRLRFSFMPSLISTLSQNVKYSFVMLFVKLPFDIIFACVLVLMLKNFAFVGVLAVVEIFAFTLIAFLLGALRLTLFYGWTPSIIVFGKGVLYGFNKNLLLTLRNFKRVFANSFYMVLTLFVINVFSAQVTFGVSLIVTLPMTVLIVSAFSMVLFYTNYGMRYYTDEYNIIVPNKMQQNEPISTTKFII